MSRSCAWLSHNSRQWGWRFALAAVFLIGAAGTPGYGQVRGPVDPDEPAATESHTVDDLMEAGQWEQAVARLNELVTGESENVEAKLKLARCYLGIAAGQLRDGLADENESTLVAEAIQACREAVKVREEQDDAAAVLDLVPEIASLALFIDGDDVGEVGSSPRPSYVAASRVGQVASDACRTAVSVARGQLDAALEAGKGKPEADALLGLVPRLMRMSVEVGGDPVRVPGRQQTLAQGLGTQIAVSAAEACRLATVRVEQSGDIGLAIAVRQEVHRLEQAYPDLLRAKALRLQSQNLINEAVDAYEAYISTDEGRTDAAARISMARLLGSQGGYYRALSVIEPLVDSVSGSLADDPYAQFTCANILFEKGDQEEAADAAKRAVAAMDRQLAAVSNESDVDRVRLARLLSEMGQYQALYAQILARQARDLRVAVDRRNKYRDAEIAWSRAIQAATQAFRISPENTSYLTTLVTYHDSRIEAWQRLSEGAGDLNNLFRSVDLRRSRGHYQSLLEYRQCLGSMERVRDSVGVSDARWLAVIARLDWIAGQDSQLAQDCGAVHRAVLRRRVIAQYPNLKTACGRLIDGGESMTAAAARVLVLWLQMDPTDTGARAQWQQIPADLAERVQQTWGKVPPAEPETASTN